MNEAVVWLTIFILSVFVGIEVISKVSSTLHTPLMSGANAIHGIILLGAVLVTGTTETDVALAVGLVAIVLAAVNMVGGFVVTDRMLQMFVRKKPKPAKPADARTTRRRGPTRDADLGAAASTCLRGLLHPRAQGAVRTEDRPRRQPDRRRRPRWSRWRCRSSTSTSSTSPLILAAIAVGSAGGVVGAQRVQMTQMPQMVALFNGVGGGAAALVALLELHEIVDSHADAVDGSTLGRDGVHDRGRLGVVRRLDRHLRQAPGADDLAAGGLPRPADRVRRRRSSPPSCSPCSPSASRPCCTRHRARRWSACSSAYCSCCPSAAPTSRS